MLVFRKNKNTMPNSTLSITDKEADMGSLKHLKEKHDTAKKTLEESKRQEKRSRKGYLTHLAKVREAVAACNAKGDFYTDDQFGDDFILYLGYNLKAAIRIRVLNAKFQEHQGGFVGMLMEQTSEDFAGGGNMKYYLHRALVIGRIVEGGIQIERDSSLGTALMAIASKEEQEDQGTILFPTDAYYGSFLNHPRFRQMTPSVPTAPRIESLFSNPPVVLHTEAIDGRIGSENTSADNHSEITWSPSHAVKDLIHYSHTGIMSDICFGNTPADIKLALEHKLQESDSRARARDWVIVDKGFDREIEFALSFFA